MGAEQSSQRHGSSSQNVAVARKCYYEVLGIERTATDDEIKKAYRRKALVLHPDRNFGDVESATKKFAEVQSAHEVLSDPQERAWYDSHRDDILQGNDGTSKGNQYESKTRLTTTKDIVSLINRFGPSVKFTDASDGFYGILKKTFESLAEEEYDACRYDNLEVLEYPEFGTSTDSYEDVVRLFYRVWVGFATKKSFSWRDQYRTSDAPDRYTRRIVEKENRKLRDEGIREFNEAVRALVTFVRRRDPRYLPNTQTYDDRQKTLRDNAAAQAARSRAANQAKLDDHVIPEWQKSTKVPEEAAFSDSENSEAEHIECVACGKTFKSEKQYETHEKSKKHMKTIYQLKREMHRENRRLGLYNEASDNGVTMPNEEFENLDVKENAGLGADEEEEEEEEEITASTPPEAQSRFITEKLVPPSEKQNDSGASSDASDTDDEYAPREVVESRLDETVTSPIVTPPISELVEDENVPTIGAGKLKIGKAKLKKAKRAARQNAECTAFKCVNCSDSFLSKSKLFDHLKDNPNHAQLISKTKGKNKKR
ncbi:putative DnaJ like protein subfamily C member 21 [Calycina marina]|uniref:DnaJ like protein subfamily C member 21 n=1 Tax=Calycina marina TaxID=1763456 RepID=A0A9P7Z8I9_9HELO|nr:putative DnaJ like protein subfamily C member 21 [Calycina marina]